MIVDDNRGSMRRRNFFVSRQNLSTYAIFEYYEYSCRSCRERKKENTRNDYSRMIHHGSNTRLKFLFSKFDYDGVDRFLARRDITGEQAVCACTRQPRCSPIFSPPRRRSESGRSVCAHETRAVATRNKLYAFKTCIVA